MYLIFFWVKREKPKKQTKKRKPVSWGKDAAGRRQTHTKVMMPSRSPSWAGLCCLLRGMECPLRGGQEPACEEAGNRLRELTDLKRRRLPRLRLPSMLSVFSACCSVFSFSSLINLK